MDIWGSIYRDHWERDPHPHVIERDDGRIERFESAAHYFEAPRFPAESAELARLGGPVLDVGAGPGSYAIHLQNHALTVTAIDTSARAVKIAGMRGCLDARVMDLRHLDFPAASFESIVVMGNTFGLHHDNHSLPVFLEELRRVTRDGGTLLTATIDPLDTVEPEHLAYHEMNRGAGRPPGLVTMRLSYREAVSDWFQLWLTSREEVEAVAGPAGWSLAAETPSGPWRVRRFTAG